MTKNHLKNKELDIFGTKFTIEYVDNLSTEDTYIYGKTIYEDKRILIATHLGKTKIPKSEQQIVLLHEIIHAILDSGEYGNISTNEPLVEWLARGINATIEQKIL